MTIFVSCQLIVTLESIRNSCDVYLGLSELNINFKTGILIHSYMNESTYIFWTTFSTLNIRSILNIWNSFHIRSYYLKVSKMMFMPLYCFQNNVLWLSSEWWMMTMYTMLIWHIYLKAHPKIKDQRSTEDQFSSTSIPVALAISFRSLDWFSSCFCCFLICSCCSVICFCCFCSRQVPSVLHLNDNFVLNFLPMQWYKDKIIHGCNVENFHENLKRCP